MSNLNSYCYRKLGEPVLNQYFSVRAKKSAMETTWNEQEGRAVSKTEQNLKEIMDEIDAMDYVEKPQKPKSNGQTTMEQHAPPIDQVDAATQDDISSFGNSLLGGQRQSAPRASAFATTFNPSDEASVAQRSVAETVSSLDSRLTALENRLRTLDRIEALLSNLGNGSIQKNGSVVTQSTSAHSEEATKTVVGTSTDKESGEAPAS